MGRVEEAADGVESPVKGVAVAAVASYEQPQVASSYPQTHQNQFVGSPWSSGLFDCHLDQTNGN